MFKVLFAYGGWQNVNYVLNDVKNPVRTLKIAGPLGLGITSVLYILAKHLILCVRGYYPLVADCSLTSFDYSTSSKEDILKSGTTVASLFFNNVFGSYAQKALTGFVALRYVLCALPCALSSEATCVTVH